MTSSSLFLLQVTVWIIISWCSTPIWGHGRLIEPPSRASAWRYGFDTPHNYNDHEQFCGGFTRQWLRNGGKCGICGDPWDSKQPRPHEYGGTYGQGVLVRKYTPGTVFNIRVELTANHFGFFEFSLCPDWRTATQECFDSNRLQQARPIDPTSPFRYYPKDGNKVYEMKYRLPNKACQHCLLQWRYIAGNNWGTCPNGTGAVGCGPQEEFRACADISIAGTAGSEEELTAPPTTPPTITTAKPAEKPPHSTDEPSYNPISALIISVMSFLAVLLILFLFYFHFYKVGRQVKNWLKGAAPATKTAPLPAYITATPTSGVVSPTLDSVSAPPIAPPRVRKQNEHSTLV